MHCQTSLFVDLVDSSNRDGSSSAELLRPRLEPAACQGVCPRCGDDADDGGLVLTQNIFLLCWSTNIFFLTSTILTLEHSSKDLIHPIRPKN